MRIKLNIFVALFLVYGISAFAQITRPTAEQAPPTPGTGQQHIDGPNESVNPATGALSIRINAGVPPARGVTVPFAFAYDSNSAQHVTGGLGMTDNASYLGQGGWSYAVPTLSQIQNMFKTFNHHFVEATDPVDPIVYVGCDIGDPACFLSAGAKGLGCAFAWCPPSITAGGTTTPTICNFFDHFNFSDMNGDPHDLGIISQNGSTDCVSVPGAPVTALVGADNMVVAHATTPETSGAPFLVPSVTIVDSSGTLYSFPSATLLPNGAAQGRVHTMVGDNPNLRSYIQLDMLPSVVEDRNGNIATFTDHGNGAFDVTDTLGRTAISTSGFGTTGSTVRIAGLANPYTLTWTPLSVNWMMNLNIIAPEVQTVPPTSCAASPGPTTYNMSGQVVPLFGITQLELPNGQSYQFQYDPIYGLISKLIYPNGGYVRYVWGVNHFSSRELIPSTEPEPSGDLPDPCEVIYDTPVIVQRFVSFDGQTEAEEQDFSYSTTWALVQLPVAIGMQDWIGKQTTVITKDLVTGTSFKTVYTYIPRPNGAKPSKLEGQAGMYSTSPVEQTIQNFDANGHLLHTKNKSYLFTSLLPAIDETDTLDNGLTSEVHRCFLYQTCTPGQLPPPGQALGTLLTDSYEYDFGPGTPGALLQHTHIDYFLFKNPLFPDVFAGFGGPSTYLGEQSTNIVYDSNGHRVAETDYGYGDAVVSATASSHDETNYGPSATITRANLTSVTAKCFNPVSGATCADGVSTYAYDETGHVVTKTDPRNNITTFSYADSFTDSSPATNTNAYPTKITLPATNGVSHIQNYTYAYSDGQVTSSTDQNGQLTSYLYNDPFRRLTETDFPDSGHLITTYNDSGANPNVVTSRTISPGSSIVSTTVMDGMQHVVQTQLNSDPAGVDFSDVTLDGLGRKIKISNPHRGSPLPTDGLTTTLYDALGRVVQVTKPDGGIASATYAGNCSVTLDEATRRRRSCSDALGRLTEVDEPTPGSSEAILATTATASVSVSGSLQSKQLSNPATGTITIIGTDSLVPGTNSYDFGTVTASIGSASSSTPYGNSGSSPSSATDVATALCSAINSTPGTSALVSCTSSGSLLNLTAKAVGSAGNGIGIGISAQTSNPQSNQSAFHSSLTSGTLSGGGATIYDSATTTITVSGRAYPIRWSGSGTSAISIASSLAAAINSDPNAVVTAMASGGSITLTSNEIGLSGNNISVACSSGYDSVNFISPSFTTLCPSGLSGGKEAGSLSAPMLTAYTYDALGNLLQVVQRGGTADQTQWRQRTFTYDSLSRLLTATNPESGTINYSYDPAGNLTQKASPQANQTGSATTTFTFCYDALNRLVAKGSVNSPQVPQQCSNMPPWLPNPTFVNTFDQGTNANGYLSSLTDQAGSASYTYFVMGRVATEQRTIAGITKNMSYTYNFDGSLATATYPSNAVIAYTPDSGGRTGMVRDLGNNINYVVGPGGLGTSASYGPDGTPTGFLNAASSTFFGITNSFTFNNRLQPVSMSALSPNAIAPGASSSAAVTITGALGEAATTTPAPLAAMPTPEVSLVASDGSSHVFYFGVSQHVLHLFWTSSGGWQAEDISAIVGSVAASNSSLAGAALTDGTLHVFYVGANQHIYQLLFAGGGWQNQDLTAITGNTLSASGTALASDSGAAGEPIHLYYLGTNQHVYGLAFSSATSAWQNTDLTSATGNTLAASNTKLSAAVLADGTTRVFYVGTNQHVYQLTRDNGGSFGAPYLASSNFKDADSWNLAAYYPSLRLGDVNGDGKPDVCGRGPGGMICALNNGSGTFNAATQWETGLSDAVGWNGAAYTTTIMLGDVNGDGKSDNCARGGSDVYCEPSTGSSFGSSVASPVFTDAQGWNQIPYYGSLRLADVNGDGKPDLCARGPAGVVCAINSGNGAFNPPQQWETGFSDAFGWNQAPYGTTMMFGDINGDGKADVCGRGGAGIYCQLSTGSSFVTLGLVSSDFSDAQGWNSSAAYYGSLRLADVNGDGKPDICGRSAAGIYCALNNGNGTFAPMQLWETSFSDAAGWNQPQYGSTMMFADINGDGRADVCGRGVSGIICELSNANPWQNQDLTAVTGNTLAAAGSAISIDGGAPAGSFGAPGGGMHAYYLGTNQHIYALTWNLTTLSWQNVDVTAISGNHQPAANSPLTGLVSNDGYVRLYFLDASNHIHETFCCNGSTWVDNDEMALLGIGAAGSGSALTSTGLSAGNNVHVYYESGSQHINTLYHNGTTGWANQDLSSSVTLDVVDSGLVSLTIGGSFTATACFGPSTNPSCSSQQQNDSTTSIASALASAINVSNSPATATASGANVNLTWKVGGTVTSPVSVLATTHDQPTIFANPSFTSAATNFSGGTTGSTSTVFSLNYDFHLGNGDNGNVWGVINNRDSTRSQTFTYDALNRLITAQNAGTDCSQPTVNGKTKFWGNSYTYDAWGNLYQKNVTKCSAEYLNATPDVQNRLHVVAPDHLYDAAGNMTSDQTDMFTAFYDPENRLATETTNGITTSYVYDSDGNRVEKSTGSSGTLYWYMLPGIVAESDLNGILQSEYIFFNGKRVARRDFTSGAVSYYFSDELKTADVITDAQGNVKADSDYYPWGGELQFIANDSNHYKFTGKERDSESGLDYFGARYYSNKLARFMTPDWAAKAVAVPYATLGDPQSLNLYSYVLDNPTVNVDPDGHACSVLLGNIGSGFCQRATEYGKIDTQVRNKTRFFAGASAVSQSLAGSDAAFGEFAFSEQTGDLLEMIGHSLRTVNLKAVSDIKSGALQGAGPELDAKLVHMEQTEVQKQLDIARQLVSPALFDHMMDEINKALNPSGLEKKAGKVYSTDEAMAKVFDGVRKALHHNIDFRNQADREAMGNAIIKHIRDTGGKDITGDKVK